MSVVFIHIGQCGIQLGCGLWAELDRLSSLLSHKSSHTSPRLRPFALLDNTLPCVLVDSEHKVVNKSLKVFGSRLDHDYVFSDSNGRGNNWAYGYYGKSRSGRSDGLCGRVCEAVRTLAERLDCFTSVVLLHSSAGGTGSGLGSAVLEGLRQEFPLAYLVSVVVTPFSQGESPLQWYNTLLSLSWEQCYSDSVLLFSNDTVGLEVGKSSKGLLFDEMNSHIVRTLANILLPSSKQSKGYFELLDLARNLTPNPTLKFITPHHTDSTHRSWDHMISTMTKRRHSKDSTQLLFIARGGGIDEITGRLSEIEGKLKRVYNTVSWNPYPVDFWLSQQPQLKGEKMLSVLANSSASSQYMRTVCERAGLMLEHKAYLHWYQQHGAEESLFKQALDNLNIVIDNYSSITG